jgi:hypothetical protein
VSVCRYCIQTYKLQAVSVILGHHNSDILLLQFACFLQKTVAKINYWLIFKLTVVNKNSSIARVTFFGCA